ncbi:MAG TPA: hypothetical protein VHU87_13410 [Rhizomicrobium sp.]|jgi:hypothetical protein|nr:hypothetical protein [Rhizomicrobium sp.]
MNARHEPIRLAPQEILFLAGMILGWGLFVICLGKDMSWDFRNYHWYIPYAFMNGRAAIDISVAHQATFYNPFLDIPFYELATHFPSWFALGVLGMAQGANAVPLYLMSRSIVRVEQKRLAAAILTVLCMTGGLTVSLSGTTYYDPIMSVFILTALALVLLTRETLRDGTILRGMILSAIAGLLVGIPVGLKLPEAPFALGLAAALLLLPGDWKHRGSRVIAAGVGGVIGVLLFAGYWYVNMYHVTGNPLFPYFNQYFHSPLALTASYRDVRFLPHDLYHALIFPLLFSINWQIADDLPFQDIRVGMAYVLVIVTLPLWLIRRQSREPLMATDALAALFGFAIVSYIAWISIFAIYRYIVLLEILGPILIAGCVALWPISARAGLVTAGLLLLLCALAMRTGILTRAPLGDPYVQATMPPILDPDHTMLLMTGNAPMGFLAPSLPHQIPIIRIDGWMIQPKDGSKLTALARRRVDAFKGDLYVIFDTYELARSIDALADYNLAIDMAACGDIETNLTGDYRICPLTRKATP